MDSNIRIHKEGNVYKVYIKDTFIKEFKNLDLAVIYAEDSCISDVYTTIEDVYTGYTYNSIDDIDIITQSKIQLEIPFVDVSGNWHKLIEKINR